MPTVKPSGEILGARIEGLDLSKPLSEENLALIFRGVGTYGVLHFPNQSLDAAALKAFKAVILDRATPEKALAANGLTGSE